MAGEVRGASRARNFLPPRRIARREARPGATVFLAVLRYDGPARAAHGYRGGIALVAYAAGEARPFHRDLQHAGRLEWSLLALRRHHLDISVSATVPGGPAHKE